MESPASPKDDSAPGSQEAPLNSSGEQQQHIDPSPHFVANSEAVETNDKGETTQPTASSPVTIAASETAAKPAETRQLVCVVTKEIVENVAKNARAWGKKANGLAISNAIFISIAFTLNLLALSITPKESILNWQPLCVAAAIASGIGLLISLLERYENAPYECGEAQRALAEYTCLLDGIGDNHAQRLREARDKWVRFEHPPSHFNPRIFIAVTLGVAILLVVTWPALLSWAGKWREVFTKAVSPSASTTTATSSDTSVASADGKQTKKPSVYEQPPMPVAEPADSPKPEIATFRETVELKTILNGNTTASLVFVRCADGPVAGQYFPSTNEPAYLQSLGMNLVWVVSSHPFSDEAEKILARNPKIASQFSHLHEVGKSISNPFQLALKQRMETDGVFLYSLERDEKGSFYLSHKGTLKLDDLKAIAKGKESAGTKTDANVQTLEYSTPDGLRATCRCYPVSTVADDANTAQFPLLCDPVELYSKGMTDVLGFEVEHNPNVPLVRIERPMERVRPFVVRLRLLQLTEVKEGEFQLKSHGLVTAAQYLRHANRKTPN